jgi:retron-type reverse transcriptase
MTPQDNLWPQFISWENLHRAARKSRRGKRAKPEVLRFQFNLEAELLSLQTDLETGTYTPGPFRTHWVFRPKQRLISAAPYRDRVLHHALMNVLEPLLERHFHAHSFACRAGKGTHAAMDMLQSHLRKNAYVLKCDIRKFFPSIDHAILKAKFRRLIADPRLLSVMDQIVDNSNAQEESIHYFPDDDLFSPHERRRGLPIGNLTSQWFANWYLSGLDHCISNLPGVSRFARYCDDFIVTAKTRMALRRAIPRIRRELARVRLKWHESKLHIRPKRCGVTFVGCRIWASHRLLTKPNVRAFRRRLRWMRRSFSAGQLDVNTVKLRLMSWMGHAGQANSAMLLRRLSKEWVFARGEKGGDAARIACCAAGPGTTTRGTAVPRTGTTTRPTIGTPTTGSGSLG